VKFRALGGAKQDAPLAQLFVSRHLGSAFGLRADPIFCGKKALLETLSGELRRPTVRLQGAKDSRNPLRKGRLMSCSSGPAFFYHHWPITPLFFPE